MDNQLAITNFLKNYDAIEAAYIFGSATSGKMRADSDVDLALLAVADKKIDHLRLPIAADLAGAFPLIFDIGIINANNLIYAAQVLFTGTLLFTKNRQHTELYTSAILGMYCNFNFARREIIRGFVR